MKNIRTLGLFFLVVTVPLSGRSALVAALEPNFSSLCFIPDIPLKKGHTLHFFLVTSMLVIDKINYKFFSFSSSDESI
ncbi:MAG TPA: hypothetical protein VJ729_10690 [Nitrososphaeraceae archaeon]|nr:hypothetical protein [Nitrososphaeraceae archaeon]